MARNTNIPTLAKDVLMRFFSPALAGFALLSAGIAAAQPVVQQPVVQQPGVQQPAHDAPAPPHSAMGGPHEGRGGPEGPRGWMMRRMMEGGRAARFEFRRGDARADIKCAADEPMKACVEAATILFDKLAPPTK